MGLGRCVTALSWKGTKGLNSAVLSNALAFRMMSGSLPAGTRRALAVSEMFFEPISDIGGPVRKGEGEDFNPWLGGSRAVKAAGLHPAAGSCQINRLGKYGQAKGNVGKNEHKSTGAGFCYRYQDVCRTFPLTLAIADVLQAT